MAYVNSVRHERRMHIEWCLINGDDLPARRELEGASNIRRAIEAYFDREDLGWARAHVKHREDKARQRQARSARLAAARSVKDAERHRERRRLKALGTGVPIRTRTDFSQMTDEQAKEHRNEKNRDRVQRQRAPRALIKPLQTEPLQS
jgi:hypothetical protein